MSLLIEIIEDRLFLPKDTRPSFSGQTIIVTGANVGLGFEAAVKFVECGASRVILGVRTLSKGEKAKEQIETRTGCESDVVEVWQLDMLDYQSVRAFAKRAEIELERLDIACLNAGVSTKDLHYSAYGWETALQVNTISTTLLSLLLLPKLKSSRTDDFTPVLEIVSSGNHQYVQIREEIRTADSPLQVYNQGSGYNTLTQYNISKLFTQYVQIGLVKALRSDDSKPPPVHVVTVCPGPVKTELARDFKQWYLKPVFFLMGILMFKTPEQGARTYISGATLGEKGNGRFWTRNQIKPPAKMLAGPENEKLQEKVWQDVLTALRKDVPEVDGLLSK